MVNLIAVKRCRGLNVKGKQGEWTGPADSDQTICNKYLASHDWSNINITWGQIRSPSLQLKETNMKSSIGSLFLSSIMLYL